ncbi:MAG TPA: class I SAM-dependent methyltransferase [Vitreimonas sp.]|nr:class I SAM-dependent methyltransferase [Vitreimonas sp.]
MGLREVLRIGGNGNRGVFDAVARAIVGVGVREDAQPVGKDNQPWAVPVNHPPTIDEIKGDWNKNAPEYHQHKNETNTKKQMDVVKVFEWELLSTLLARIGTKGAMIADMGSGEALFERLISDDPRLNQFKGIVAVDISRKMLENSGEFIESQRAAFPTAEDSEVTASQVQFDKRVLMVEGSMANQILANNSMDLIVYMNSADGVNNEDLQASLDMAFRILKPGGKMLILIRHPERNGYYALKQLNKEVEGVYRETWDGASLGVVAFYRYSKTWYKFLSRAISYSLAREDQRDRWLPKYTEVRGQFKMWAEQDTGPTESEAERYPALAKRYRVPGAKPGDPDEFRKGGKIFVLEKRIDETQPKRDFSAISTGKFFESLAKSLLGR